jgi:hypothetical protein
MECLGINELKSLGTGKASSNPEEIIWASSRGRVKCLFLAKGQNMLGSYDPESDKLVVHEKEEPARKICWILQLFGLYYRVERYIFCLRLSCWIKARQWLYTAIRFDNS